VKRILLISGMLALLALLSVACGGNDDSPQSFSQQIVESDISDEVDDHSDEADNHDEVDTHAEEPEGHVDGDAHDEADDHSDEVEATIELIATETSPGIYVATIIFDDDGTYSGKIQIGEEEVPLNAAVRSREVAWNFLIGVAAIPALLAGIVAVRKTVRKEW